MGGYQLQGSRLRFSLLATTCIFCGEKSRDVPYLSDLERITGFRRPQLNAMIDDTLAATREYPERIMALPDVPEANREHLSRISASG